MFPPQVSIRGEGKIPVTQPFLTRQDLLNGFDVTGYDTWNLRDIQIQTNQLFKIIGVGVSLSINFDLPDHDQILAAKPD